MSSRIRRWPILSLSFLLLPLLSLAVQAQTPFPGEEMTLSQRVTLAVEANDLEGLRAIGPDGIPALLFLYETGDDPLRTRLARLFHELAWPSPEVERALVRDDKPSYYLYRMVMEGHTQTGVAFVGSVRAYEEQRIRRHELTRPDKENDRVRNIATLNAQTGPVLLAYRANDALRELLTVGKLWELAQPERRVAGEEPYECTAVGESYVKPGVAVATAGGRSAYSGTAATLRPNAASIGQASPRIRRGRYSVAA